MRFYLEYINHSGRLQKKSAHRRLQAGFTITEVLLAGLMMLIAVLVAGNGLINLLRSNYRANADSEIQNNLNRTLEFVSDDVRRASRIADSQDEIMADHVPEEARAEGARVVLAFQIPNPNNLSPLRQIVYYTQNRQDGDSLTGPRVLWRFGPDLDENGNYNIDSWQHSPVTDMLAGTANNTCPEDADFNLIAADPANVDGFFACVHEDGDQVILNAKAQVNLTTGNTDRDKVKYSVSTRVVPRATRPNDCGQYYCLATSPPPATSTDSSTPPATSPDSSTPPFGLPDNDGSDSATVPILTVAAEVKAEVIERVDCSSCLVATGSPDTVLDWGMPGQGQAIPSTVQANAGDSIKIEVNGMSNFYWDQLLNQTVKVYTSDSSNLPANINSLNNNQVLLVLTSPPNSYQVLVTITPR